MTKKILTLLEMFAYQAYVVLIKGYILFIRVINSNHTKFKNIRHDK